MPKENDAKHHEKQSGDEIKRSPAWYRRAGVWFTVAGVAVFFAGAVLSYCSHDDEWSSYRYYPWKGERPKGVDQFIPCDFDPGLTHVVKAGTLNLIATAGNVTATVQRKPPDEPRPQEEDGADRKDDQQNPKQGISAEP